MMLDGLASAGHEGVRATSVAEGATGVMPLWGVRLMLFSGSSGFSCSTVSARVQLALVARSSRGLRGRRPKKMSVDMGCMPCW